MRTPGFHSPLHAGVIRDWTTTGGAESRLARTPAAPVPPGRPYGTAGVTPPCPPLSAAADRTARTKTGSARTSPVIAVSR